MNSPPDICLFFGRLHPMLVHLPIGLLLLLATLEGLARVPRFRDANASAGFILALAAPVAAVTALCGWLLSLGGGYENGLLQWHKWAGISTAALAALAAVLYRLELKKAYCFCLLAAVVVLGVAGHLGGSLTHGSNYLLRFAPKPLRILFGTPEPARPAEVRVENPLDLPAFAGVVQPTLQHNCVPCHGPEKSKAKLRLDSLSGLLAGGESGPAIVPGQSADSRLYLRLRLPLSHEDHMPPEGKPQPGPDEIALIGWWIEAGAPGDKTIGELKPPADIASILAARYGLPAERAKDNPGPTR